MKHRKRKPFGSMVKGKQAYIWIILILIGSSFQIGLAEEKTFVAYSMRVAQQRVKAATRSGKDFRKNEPDLYYLSGITKPWAVVFDVNSGDWILVGERDPKCSILTLEDWVVALRTRFIHPQEDPGVTIEPRPCDMCLKNGEGISCSHSTKQDVYFFGGIENTHFGQVCYDADWLAKKISLGLENVPVQKLKTHHDLYVEYLRNSRAGHSRIISRSWFYPIVNRVNVLDNVVLLEKFQMGLFTEVLYAEIDGKPVADMDKFVDYPSETFSQLFSENYDEIAQAREPLETLRGLTRLAALAKGLTQLHSRLSLDSFVTDYPLKKSTTPQEVDVLKVEHREYTHSGGVRLAALAMRLNSGDVGALRSLLRRGRPTPNALSWGFKVEIEDGQLVGISLPAGGADPSQRAWLFSHGVFLANKKRYDAAIECFDKLLRTDPNDLDAYCYRGVVFLEHRMPERALEDFKKALQIDPTHIHALCLKGDALSMLDQHEQAILVFEEALEKNPYGAILWADKGAALKEKHDYEEAIDCYERAIDLDAMKPIFWRGKGVVLATLKRYAEALACFDQALTLQRSDGWAWYHKGEMLQRIGRFREAIDCFEKASPFVPEEIQEECTRYIQLLQGH
jgi:tetratricopeptide (TPR) repeat protein